MSDCSTKAAYVLPDGWTDADIAALQDEYAEQRRIVSEAAEFGDTAVEANA